MPDFSRRPMLVFWETTRACALACLHCRASATLSGLPGELSTAEGRALIDQVAGFGSPPPILILTGGDCLARPDLFELVEYASGRGIPVALSPSVTERLTPEQIRRMVAAGVRAVSVSLDGASATVHDAIRGVRGHFEATARAIGELVGAGLTVQVNTTVMRSTVADLPEVAALLAQWGVAIWEVFFLVQTGRGVSERGLAPEQNEAVCHFLYDASHHGFIVRTVEAPFFRRVVAQRSAGGPAPEAGLYPTLADRLTDLLGPPVGQRRSHTAATRDGKGIVFVAHDGTVYPAGFLPTGLGTVRSRPLAEIYREHPDLVAIRSARFGGRCGQCEFADLCGGSRARAFAATGDVLAEDPGCAHRPAAATAAPAVPVSAAPHH